MDQRLAYTLTRHQLHWVQSSDTALISAFWQCSGVAGPIRSFHSPSALRFWYGNLVCVTRMIYQSAPRLTGALSAYLLAIDLDTTDHPTNRVNFYVTCASMFWKRKTRSTLVVAAHPSDAYV